MTRFASLVLVLAACGSPRGNLGDAAPAPDDAVTDLTPAIVAGDSGVLIRIKAGPNSGVLVVHRVELCMQAS